MNNVDVMFAYLNTHEHCVANTPTKDLVEKLHIKSWTGDDHKNYYSAIDVLKNMKKYRKDYERIEQANLKYPIIMNRNNIIDGVHRVAKAYHERGRNVKVYVFDDKLMEKFLLSKTGNWKKVESLQICDFIKLFYKNFK